MRLLAFLLMMPFAALATTPEEPVLDLAASRIAQDWFGGLTVDLALSEAVPYAVGVTDAPPRLVVRFHSAVEMTGQTRKPPLPALIPEGLTTELQLPMDRRRVLESAVIDWPEEGGARLRLKLDPADEATFQAAAARWQARPLPPPPEPPAEGFKLKVMIDPGHGGQDPGAEYDGIREADIVLLLAEDLRTRLEAAGLSVDLTRADDSFVTLSDRIGRATRAGADVFLSLHADAVAFGHATGASVHSLSAEAGAAGDRFLLNRLGNQAMASTDGAVDDATLKVLMDLAREQTLTASDALAADLVAAMAEAGVVLYKTPQKHSNFVVLRAADIPSVLVELGYLSEPEDRARLVDPLWRAKMAEALAQGVLDWSRAGRP